VLESVWCIAVIQKDPTLTPRFHPQGLLAAPWLLKDRFDNEVRMSKLGVPILVLHGDCDDIVPYWQGKAVSELNPKARLVTVPDAAHNDLFASSVSRAPIYHHHHHHHHHHHRRAPSFFPLSPRLVVALAIA
jgi:fermentation-respiration switch protein FrsA (DUF1100 family)